MNTKKRMTPKEFFTEFCEKNPTAAHRLMITMLRHPTGGVSFTMPDLINPDEHSKYWRAINELTMEFIFKPATDETEGDQ